MKLIFKHDGHVTKRTFRFKEIDEDTDKQLEQIEAVVGTIYIKKTAFEKGGVSVPPDKIVVEISVD